jgi:hypothetical protein
MCVQRVAVCCTGVCVVCWSATVAVCCSVLQCVAVCCSVLQCVAVCCRGFRRSSVFRGAPFTLYRGAQVLKNDLSIIVIFVHNITDMLDAL